ncbi:MAG: hypothetical protein KC657_25690 [Myxococcales bacterium]|nr:hypothetical protein [Myxococcales bacterium]
MSTIDQTPPTSRPARFDMYGPIHKALRHTLAGLLSSLGATSFASAEAPQALMDELEAALVFSERHIEHEDAFIRGPLLERAPTAVPSLDAAHLEHERLVAEIRGLARAVQTSSAAARPALARALYLQVGAFVADTLVHMNEEERVVQPLLERLFTDEELLEMHGKIIASISPGEMLEVTRRMIPAVSLEERVAILAGARASAPPEAFAAVAEVARTSLRPDQWREVAVRLGIADATAAAAA